MIALRQVRLGAAAALALVLAACSGDGFATGPEALVQSSVVAAADASPTLLSCPNLRGKSASRRIGPNGGSVTIAGTKLIVPPGAVSAETELVMSIPVSQYLEIDIVADGREHFEFERPVTIRVNYAHCRSEEADLASLSAWHVDDATHDFLQGMESVDDKRGRKVTFQTDHLSRYAIAW
ncbi:MAG TPA: hypothetical protein VFZ11_11030 [Gemmatimonadaceae bacterium]